ncbi:MAG: glycosyltransferase family 4 protein [Planctomycetota bacterium]
MTTDHGVEQHRSLAADDDARPTPPIFVHVPTPGDHYGPVTGSAIITLVYEMSRVHERFGGRSRVLVNAGTRGGYPVGERVEVAADAPPVGRRGKITDVARGRLGLRRAAVHAAYRRHVEAMDPAFDGVIFVHNNPAAVEPFKRRCPRATVCLWAANELFATYGRREARRVARHTDRAICVSRFIADRLPAPFHDDPGRVHAVVSGIDVERFRPGPAPPGPPVILFVGRVLPEKGPDLLIDAMRRLDAEGLRDFRLKIVGSSNFNSAAALTPFEQRLRRLAEPIRDRVIFRPFVDRDGVVEEYRAATIACIPSNWDEPLGLVVAEAMACGLPVVAARRGGIPEPGGDAVEYFDPPDVAGLAEKLGGLLRDPGRRAGLGEAARRRALGLSWMHQYHRLTEALGPWEPVTEGRT